MANWVDYCSLVITLFLIAAVIYGVLYMNESIRKIFYSTKESLHSQGVDVSSHGASLKTRTKLSNRENYFDATQRGFIKAMNASSKGHSVGHSPNVAAQSHVPSSLRHRDIASSLTSSKSAHDTNGRSSGHHLLRRSNANV